jgi:hypothetical protein
LSGGKRGFASEKWEKNGFSHRWNTEGEAKLQAPTSKLQRNFNLQNPNFREYSKFKGLLRSGGPPAKWDGWRRTMACLRLVISKAISETPHVVSCEIRADGLGW